MSSKQNKNKKRYRFLFLLSLLTIIGLLIIIYTLDTELETLDERDTIPVSSYEELESEFDKLKELIAVDDVWMLENNPEKALKNYKRIDFSDDALNTKVNKRIQRVQDIIESNNDDELTKINLRTELNKAIEGRDSLSSQLDSLQQTYKLSINKRKRKIDSLENELTNISRQLERRETLKVISFKSDRDILIHYIGETKNEKANGSGVGVWANGSIYRGEWTNNKPNGRGEFKWADGAKYEGDFVMGERSGEGTFYYATGEKYEGDFKLGVRSGKGTLYDIDGNVSYEGQWKNDKPQD